MFVEYFDPSYLHQLLINTVRVKILDTQTKQTESLGAKMFRRGTISKINVLNF